MRKPSLMWVLVAALCGSMAGPAAAVEIVTEIVAIGCGEARCANGQLAPDGNGRLVDVLSRGNASINEAGQVVFVAELVQTAGGFNNDDTGIFTATSVPGSLRQVARAAQSAPSGNGNFTNFALSLPINDAGQVVFCTDLRDTFGSSSDRYGLFSGDGTPGGLVELSRGGSCPTINTANENGEVAFISSDAVFLGSGSPFTQITGPGRPSPDGDGVFRDFAQPALNDAGQLAFTASLTANRIVHYGVFRADPTVVTQIARTGDPTPDGNGVFFSFTNPAINNAGDVAFPASLTGTSGSTTDNQGIYISRGNTLLTIARRGQPAPDGNGRFFELTGAHFNNTADRVAINEAGQVAFHATFTGTAGGGAAAGLLRGDGATLKQIIRVGDLAPDGVSRIKSLSFPALNDAGQVAFRAELVQGAAVPEIAIFLYDDTLGLLQMFRGGTAVLGSQISKEFTIRFQPSITSFGKHHSGLNELGQVVAQFFLNDGRSVVAIASVGTPVFTCVGDCDGNEMVDVGEIIRLVTFALGTGDCTMCQHGIPPDVLCPSGVTVSEIIQAVNIALGTVECGS